MELEGIMDDVSPLLEWASANWVPLVLTSEIVGAVVAIKLRHYYRGTAWLLAALLTIWLGRIRWSGTGTGHNPVQGCCSRSLGSTASGPPWQSTRETSMRWSDWTGGSARRRRGGVHVRPRREVRQDSCLILGRMMIVNGAPSELSAGERWSPVMTTAPRLTGERELCVGLLLMFIPLPVSLADLHHLP